MFLKLPTENTSYYMQYVSGSVQYDLSASV
jgi:hypothetical protein